MEGSSSEQLPWSQRVWQFLELNRSNLPYKDIVDVYNHLASLSNFHLHFAYAPFPSEDGTLVNLIGFEGPLQCLQPTGNILHITIAGWLPASFPDQAPEIYVYPSHDLVIPFRHPHVSPCGTVSIPILQNWSANLEKSSAQRPTLESAISQVGVVLGGHPPFYSRRRSQANTVPHIPSNLLRYYLDNKTKIKDDLSGLLSDFPKLELSGYPYNKTVRLPQVHGWIPVLYKGHTYKIYIQIWLGHSYPRIAPQVCVIPKKYEIKLSHSFVNVYGVVNVPLLRNWCERHSSLQGLVWNLTDLFGIDPPVRSKSKVPPHLRYPQEEDTREEDTREEDTHEEDTREEYTHECDNAPVHVQRAEESTSASALDEIYAMFSDLH